MAKTTGPLMSLDASGTIGKTLTFSKWRGVKYVRQRVIPENPNTSAQVLTRSVFSWLVEAWKLAPTLLVTPWDTHALGRAFTGRNAFIGANVAAMRSETDIDNLIGSPGARGGLPPATLVATDGTGKIVVTVTPPAVPTGWTLDALQAACFPAGNPQNALSGVWVAAEEVSTPWEVVDLPSIATGTYQVVGWLEWTKPDGRVAYSVSLGDQIVVA